MRGGGPPTDPGFAPVDFGAAADFLRLLYSEHPQPVPMQTRLAEVRDQIAATGTYQHTSAELVFGARVAWRNSARCIGRLYWNSLYVRDRRTLTDPHGVAEDCVDHLRDSTRNGRIRSTITIYAPDGPDGRGPRILNEQLIRYAGYQVGPASRPPHHAVDHTDPDADRPGSTPHPLAPSPTINMAGTHRPGTGAEVLGDPRTVRLTAEALALGWQPPHERGGFDVLPLLVAGADDRVALRSLPEDVVLQVDLDHPEHDWFADLGLRWHAVPVISDMTLDIGGISYPAAPFNGYYLGTEVGARNLADTDRYNMLPTIAERLGLDVSSPRTLWQDRALVELVRAVHHSFDRDGVTMADHHTESDRFLTHAAREQRAGRACPTEWSWIVPPMSASTTSVFHRYYDPPDPHARPAFLSRRGAGGCPV